jgi:hypothetical protein
VSILSLVFPLDKGIKISFQGERTFKVGWNNDLFFYWIFFFVATVVVDKLN